MKVEFSEYEFGTEITLYPETAKELAAIARMVKNTKRQSPNLSLDFGKNESQTPTGYIWMEKFSPKSTKTSNSIHNEAT